MEEGWRGAFEIDRVEAADELLAPAGEKIE